MPKYQTTISLKKNQVKLSPTNTNLYTFMMLTKDATGSGIPIKIYTNLIEAIGEFIFRNHGLDDFILVHTYMDTYKWDNNAKSKYYSFIPIKKIKSMTNGDIAKKISTNQQTSFTRCVIDTVSLHLCEIYEYLCSITIDNHDVTIRIKMRYDLNSSYVEFKLHYTQKDYTHPSMTIDYSNYGIQNNNTAVFKAIGLSDDTIDNINKQLNKAAQAEKEKCNVDEG